MKHIWNLVFQLAGMGLCRHCQGILIKAGKQKSGRQRYQCKSCRKYKQINYRYNACTTETINLSSLHNEECGIRSISRILEISSATVIRRLKRLSKTVCKPVKLDSNLAYEVDEVQTYIGSKENRIRICYAIERKSRQIVDFIVGRRTTENLRKITDQVLSFDPKRVYTDYLNIYPSIIPKSVHQPARYKTNIIERMNLTLRTHLKRLGRKTICFSRSIELLEASLKLYFWWKPQTVISTASKV